MIELQPKNALSQVRVALIHDYLNQYGGAEKTFEAILELFPDAEVYASIYEPGRVSKAINDHKIFHLDNPVMRMFPKYLTFLMPFVFENFDLRQYDLVLSDSACWAKGVLTNPDQLHISFIHTPPRFLYKYSIESAKRNIWYFKPVISVLDALLRVWDFAAAQRPNFLLANSYEIQKRIQKFYNRESTVIYPPVEIDYTPLKPQNKIESPYFIVVGRMSAYKHFDLVIKAFNDLNKTLVVVGRGLEEKKLRELANDNIIFINNASDEEKAALVQNAQGLINAVDDEDFGIVPVEAMAQGVPVLVHKSGGHLESVTENKTGMFFEELTVECLKTKLLEFEKAITEGVYNAKEIKESVQKFSKQRFQKEYIDFVTEKWEQHQKEHARTS